MAEIILGVPGLLADCLGGRRSARLVADTPADALKRMLLDYPLLKPHLYDEQGGLREHVFLAYNGRNLKRLPSLEQPLADGDRIDVVQAVSGG